MSLILLTDMSVIRFNHTRVIVHSARLTLATSNTTQPPNSKNEQGLLWLCFEQDSPDLEGQITRPA